MTEVTILMMYDAGMWSAKLGNNHSWFPGAQASVSHQIIWLQWGQWQASFSVKHGLILYCFWRSLSVAALPEFSTGCGLNNAALVGDFYWSQRFIANWLGEYFRPAICVFWCSSSTIYESLPECSAFLISCSMIFTHCSASQFYVRSRACRHDRDSLFPHEIQEHTMVKWLIVCIYKLWNLMTWSDALDMCYDTFRSFIFKSCQFWVWYVEQQSTATRKSCHPVVIMSMVTCKKYKKYRQWDRLHLNYLSVLGTLSYITVSALYNQ